MHLINDLVSEPMSWPLAEAVVMGLTEYYEELSVPEQLSFAMRPSHEQWEVFALAEKGPISPVLHNDLMVYARGFITGWRTHRDQNG
jgi:hypothetical protein